MAPKRATDFYLPAAASNHPAPTWAVTGTLLACLTVCFVVLTRLISDSSGTNATLPSPANLVPASTPASQMQLQTTPTQPIKKPTGSYSNPETRNTPAPAPSYAALTSVERTVSEHGPAPAIPAAESIPKKDNEKAEVKKAISHSMAPGQRRVDPLPGAKQKKAKNCNPKIPVAANLSLPNGCEWWDVMHKKFVVDIQEADAGEGFDIIFYGDSLTEMWRGTRSNQPYAPRSHMPGVFKAQFGTHHRAIALGMSGDTTGNVRWRLMHGELPRLRHPAAVVLLAGTNDLRDARVAASALKVNKGNLVAAGLAVTAAAPSIADRIVAIVNLMREKMPAAVIVLVGILPRHKMNHHGPLVWPNMYSEGLELVNARLEAFAETASNVSYIDCGQPFFATPNLLNADLMPDALHPSAAGVEILAKCIGGALEGVLGSM